MQINDPAVVEEVQEQVLRYEQALGVNDIVALDGFFWQSPSAVRYGIGECLYGIDAISGLPQSPPGRFAPRDILRMEIMTLGRDHAVANIEFRPDRRRYDRPPKPDLGTTSRRLAHHVGARIAAGRQPLSISQSYRRMGLLAPSRSSIPIFSHCWQPR